MAKEREKKKVKNILLAKQKQVVNIFTQHNPRAQRRSRPPRQQGQLPLIRTVYQNVPMFHPLPTHPQPVGTASDIHLLLKNQLEHKARLDEHEKRMNTPNTVSFGNRDPHPLDNVPTQSAHEVGTSLRQPLQDPTAAPRRLHPAFDAAARPDFNYMHEERSDAAEGGGGTIRLTKKGLPDKRFGKR